MNRLSKHRPIALCTFALCTVALLAAGASRVAAQTICWEGQSAAMPHDLAIPAPHRLDVLDQEQQLSMVGNVLNVNDAVEADRVVLFQDLDSLGPSDAWEMTIEIQMTSSHRTAGIPLGNQCGVSDSGHVYQIGIDATGVGFAESSTTWVQGQFVAMDLSDQLHTFRIRATTDRVDLYIDASPQAALSFPKSAFPTSSLRRLLVVANSIIGTANFDIASFRFALMNSGLALCACPPLLAAGDAFTIQAVDGQAFSPLGLFLSSVNGSPLVMSLLFGAFNASNTWNLNASAPPGLAGIELGMILFGFDKHTGKLALSNEALLAFP